MKRTHLVPFTRTSRRLIPVAGAVALATLLGVTACAEPSDVSPSAPASETATPTQEATGDLQFIHRDGYDLASYLTAGTTGTIVFDAGGGNDASYWNAIVPVIAKATGAAVVTYDRTGAGLSDDVPGAFDPAAAGEDLAAVLGELDLPDGPVVLAGHSISGEVSHALVSAHPDLVDGAVLIDANLPPFFTPDEVARLVEANEAQIEELKTQPSTRETRQFLAVAQNWGPVHTAFHTVTWPAQIPVAVVVSEQTPFDPESEDAANWRAAAATFASQAANRSLTTAEGTSHDVPLDDPALVEQKIEDMFGAL